MERVTGIGGIFFKSRDPKALTAWYREHLGLPESSDGSVLFHWRQPDHPERTGYTIWAPFSQDTRYFDPSPAPFMINYRVRDLSAMLQQLRSQGVTVDDRIEDSEYGRFGWFLDPEGNRIELWQPPPEK